MVRYFFIIKVGESTWVILLGDRRMVIGRGIGASLSLTAAVLDSRLAPGVVC